MTDAENARVNLVKNDTLKKLVVDCINGAQWLLYRIKYLEATWRVATLKTVMVMNDIWLTKYKTLFFG